MTESSGRSATFDAAVITVRGVRRAVFVEFEYSLADGELAVELIMPLHALREFCSARRAQLRFATPDAERAYNELSARRPDSRS